MYEVLNKDTIKSEILQHLSVAKRGYVSQSDLVEVIQCILYKLKTGCQWHMLSVSSFFSGRVLHYKTVYGHFRKWSRNDEWEKSQDDFIVTFCFLFDNTTLIFSPF